MRKIALIVSTLAILLLGVLPIAAQDETIVDVASSNSDFSILVQAVQAADLVETLSGEGPFTVFAPTNDAFLSAIASLGLDPSTLLEDTSLLEGILLYHVVEGAITSDQIEDGAELTTVGGETITVSVDEDGTVVLNDSVTVITTDIEASNGVIHSIAGVLLPPSFMMMEEPAEETSEEATEEATEEMATEEPAEEMEAPLTGTAYVRIGHLAGDVGEADIYLDGELRRAFTGYDYGSITGYLSLTEGTHTIQIVPAGRQIGRAVVDEEFTFEDGEYVTILAYGNAFSSGVEVAVLDDETEVGDGVASVTVVHAIPDAPVIDVVTAEGDLVAGRIGFPGSLTLPDGSANDGAYTFTINPGTYDLQVVPNGQTGPVLLDLAGTELAGGTSYVVVAYGTAANPMVTVVSN